ncbi:MAG: hypothetical protein R2828_10065 [Saprospiraceae bacterium]
MKSLSSLSTRLPTPKVKPQRPYFPKDSFANYRQFLIIENQALYTRLGQAKSFELSMPMVAAANISLAARKAIFDTLGEGVQDMKAKIKAFNIFLNAKQRLRPEEAQKTFSLLKLKFNWLLDSMDIFADVLTLRGEHGNGVWLSGMDALAEDALVLDDEYFVAPPLITYLDRGHGAAIRRARTRLPGGKSNPVGVIRIPRERMISTGIASSLVHEVGHQGAALLGLISSLRQTLRQKAALDVANRDIWEWYERWISEILSDFWSVAMIGIGSTTGLINVVSLPSYFVFRLKKDDPHPPPWIRVRLSIAIGAKLYPDAQWTRLEKLWDRLYPIHQAGTGQIQAFKRLEALIPKFVHLLVHHSPPALKGKPLHSIFPTAERQVNKLRALHREWNQKPALMKKARPSLVFAVVGQARADGQIMPQQENLILDKMLRAWALRRHIF